jgi:hypothetical protein
MALGLILTLFSSCKKEADHHEEVKDPIGQYSASLPAQTVAELTAARNATARYQSIDSAVADGYADINVVVQNMGFHYMKAELVDTVFNPQKPELLVYNKQHDGRIELVAVEYAVPIPMMPDHAPEGFTGGADVWTYSTTFNLWLLHAWVWNYNPWGIFVPNNPNVHLH